MTDVLNVIVVEIKEYQIWKTDKVLDLGDQVVLQVQQTEALLTLKEGHVGKFPLVQLQSFWVRCSLTRLPVHDQNPWNLGEFSKDDLVIIFNLSDNSICEQVAVSLVIFSLM